MKNPASLPKRAKHICVGSCISAAPSIIAFILPGIAYDNETVLLTTKAYSIQVFIKLEVVHPAALLLLCICCCCLCQRSRAVERIKM